MAFFVGFLTVVGFVPDADAAGETAKLGKPGVAAAVAAANSVAARGCQSLKCDPAVWN